MPRRDFSSVFRAILSSCLSVWALGLGLAAPSASFAQDVPSPATTVDIPSTEREEAYRARVREALKEYDGGHYREALALFEAAYALTPSARAQRGIALVQFELGLYAACVASIDAALRNPHDPLPEGLRMQLAEVRARAAHFVGSLRVKVSPSSARVLVDGVPVASPNRALTLTMGKHSVVATAVGFRSEQRSAEVRGGRETTLEIALQPAIDPAQALAHRKRMRRTWGSLLAVSVAGTGAAATWLGLSARDLRLCRDGEATGATCTSETGLSRHTWGAATLSAAGLSLAVASTLGLVRASVKVRELALGCAPDIRSLSCHGSLRW